MEQNNPMTPLKDDLLNHLFVFVPCPKCKEVGAISLDMICKGMEVDCQGCKTKMHFALPGQKLDDFARSFAILHKQLHKVGLELAFFHEPLATIWAQTDKP